MHLVDRIIRCEEPGHFIREGMRKSPLGPEFSEEQLDKSAVLTIMGSDFNEPGDDYTIFTLTDKDDAVVATQRVAGY